MAENNTKKVLITKILFLIGIIVLIFIFAFALIKIVPKIFSGLASVGQFVTSPFNSKTIKLSTDDKEINSGDKFILSWKYDTNKDGDYKISYKCQQDLSLQIVSAEGLKTLVCNNTYNLKQSKSIQLIASLKKQNTFVDLPIKIDFISSEDDSVLASGEITLGIKNESKNAGETIIISETVNDNEIVDSNKNNSSTKQTINYGPADLAISNAYALNDTSITFTVSNIGGSASGVWYFNYTDPRGSTQTSPAQISLSRGQGLRFTLNFDRNIRGEDVRIVVDPQNSISESNRYNNTDIIKIEGGDGSSIDNDYNSKDDADLRIMEMEVGRLSGSKFTEDDEIEEDDEAAVRFIVKNIGGESTGSWKYEITNLPYDNDDDFESKTQSSLRPGESREIIIGFDSPDEGNYDIKVKVDSDDDVDEESESNNTKTEELEVRN